MKQNIKNLSVFVSICAVITLLLAVTNAITAPIIEKNQNAAANEALLQVMPDGSGFEKVDTGKYTLPSTVTEVYKETAGKGYVVKLITAGYGSDMVIMCGIMADGTVSGAVCLSSNETLGKEKTYGESFVGKDADGVAAVDTVGGATKTTAAYKNAVKDAINTAKIMGGEQVDVRTEEEILADNLAAALPAGNRDFEKLFRCDAIEGVDAVYAAKNGAGYVFVMGERFIGTDADGRPVGNSSLDFAEVVQLIQSWANLEQLDLSAFPDLKGMLSAHKTANGNYVLQTQGAGYGIKGGNEYHPASGEYIVVKLSVTPDGTIIDCLTVSQGETKGLGDACADEKFYGQFVGKDPSNYTEIDAIGGATMTTDGYKQAIERAFAALQALKGGA